jgi:cell division protein FtsB
MRRILLVAAIMLVTAAWAVADRETGVGTWIELDRELHDGERRLGALRDEIAGLEAEADALEADSLAIEGAIRTDLGLAQPGETIVRIGTGETTHGAP